MRLSLAMIVRNEAATLERALASARPYVDQVVIVDTGSTDGTQAIARRYADLFVERPWPDSFAEARNWSLELCSGDFIFILDADEYVAMPEDWQAVRAAMRPDVAAAECQVVNTLNGGSSADIIWQVRLLRNHQALRYEGRVHHQVLDSLRRFIQFTETKLARVNAHVIHTGYDLTLEERRTKYLPRIPLVEQSIEDAFFAGRSRERAYFTYQLASMQYMVADYEATLRTLDALVTAELSPGLQLHAHILGCKAGLEVGNVRLADYHATEARQAMPHDAQALLLSARVCLATEREVEGLAYLCEAYLHRSDGRFVVSEESARLALAEVLSAGGMDTIAGALKEEDGAAEVIQRLLGSIMATT